MVDKSTSELSLKSPPKYIVPPGLEYSVIEFESHCQISLQKPIMIIGPTGVGKSLFLHIFKILYKEHNNLIGKKDEDVPIITANCAHFEGANVRSELFGYVEGSFTGALKDGKEGLIEKAHGGVLILEEIGTLPKDVQAMLLTFIETNKFYKFGGVEEEYADVQIIGATNDEMTLRDDFRYRFNPFFIPPIYERREDILYYLAFSHPDVINILRPYDVMSWLSHNWPGNVREIERLGSLLKRKAHTMNSFLKKKGKKYYTSSRWIYDIPHDLHIEDYINLSDGSTYVFEKKQTDLDVFLPGRLYQNNSEIGDNFDIIYFNIILTKLHVSLEPQSWTLAFHQYPQNDKHEYIEISDELSERILAYDDKYESTNSAEPMSEEEIAEALILFPDIEPGYTKFPKFELDTILIRDERFNVYFCNEKSIYGKAFERAYRGLCFFCKYFYRNVYSNKNVVDFENDEYAIPYLEKVHPRGFKKTERAKLQKEIFRYLSGIELKKKDKIPEDAFELKHFLEDLRKKHPNNEFLNTIFGINNVVKNANKKDVFWDKDYNTVSQYCPVKI